MKNAYIIKAEEVIKNKDNEVEEVVCSYDPKSKSGSGTEESSRKVKATIHWLGRAVAVTAKVNDYDRLFKVSEPGKEKSITEDLNENSLETLDITFCAFEKSLCVLVTPFKAISKRPISAAY